MAVKWEGFLMKTFGKFVLGTAQTFYHGWVITVLWRWGLVPIGVPQISVVQAACVDAILTVMTLHLSTMLMTDGWVEQSMKNWAPRLIVNWMVPMLILGILWVARLIVG
jgi:hypothetical protein